MSKPKLFVMHNRLVEYIKAINEISFPPKIYLGFRERGKTRKNLPVTKSNLRRDFSLSKSHQSRIQTCKKTCLVWKKNQANNLWFSKNQTDDSKLGLARKHANGVFNFILRSLYVPIFYQNLKLRSKTPWKFHLLQAKDKKKLKYIWTRTKSENAIPSLSRGLKRKSGSVIDETVTKISKVGEKLKEKEEFNTVFKRLAEQYNGTIEQRLYTQPDFSTEKRRILKTDTKESQFGVEQKEPEIPPAQKCRLGCPLPPPEFGPQERTEFLPNYQPPSVRFGSQPAEFLPPKKPSTESGEYYTLKMAERNSSSKTETTTSVPAKMISSKKIYPSNSRPKPQLYESQQNETPKMKALLFEPNNLELNYYAVNAPTQIHKDEVLVQVVYSGVCGTDLFITDGKINCGDGPLILGHEISGKVYALGSEVNHVKSGDNVVVNPYTACCSCRYCTRGLLSSCTNEGLNNAIGIYKNGGWAEFVVVKKSQIYKIPKELGLDQAALIQPLSCVLSAMSKLNLSIGLDILVQGLGLAGCLWASALHAKGHKNVFVSDKSGKRRQQFQSLNLGYAVFSPEEIGQRTADVIIECTGSPLSIEKCLKMLRPHGQMCLFGKPSPTTEIRCMPYEIVTKEITIIGSTGNTFSFSKAVDLAAAMGHRYIDFDKLDVKVFDLKDFKEAFQLKKSGEVGKIMFKFES